MSKSKISEFRLYPFIRQSLEDVEWNTKSPLRGGDVYEQSEALQNSELKSALGLRRPENIVVLGKNRFWVIEAKAGASNLDAAIKQAKERAKEINRVSGISCPIITGVAGDEDIAHYVQTECLVGDVWQPLLINQRASTGFISPAQVEKVLSAGNGKLEEYEIDDNLFSKKVKEINDILHGGAFHKRNRAGVLACLLLALANDAQMQVSKVPTTLINDINIRAKVELKKHDKGNFYNEISINPPTSTDNHIKNRKALTQTIEILRKLNIASTINSGRDVLGQCYEQFLKYANDAKELGIVLTPRHIANFGAEIINIQRNDLVFDPTCGTGGFLVSALDKVRRDGGDIDQFKKGNLHGIEQDPGIATLAIVNMVFRGDGSSNIKEGDCFKSSSDIEMDKVLMNPPFALVDKEWQFVDKAISQMRKGGLLFAVLPATTMGSGGDGRGEMTWRKQMLERHTLLAVIKLPEDLFYPHVAKGTYGVVLRAHCPHNQQTSKVVWAILHDGVIHSKMKSMAWKNMDVIQQAVKHYISSGTLPSYKPAELDCSVIVGGDVIDLSPEQYIGSQQKTGAFDISFVTKNNMDGNRKILPIHSSSQNEKCGTFLLTDFFEAFSHGKSGRKKYLPCGNLPLISTSEKDNGISALVDRSAAKKVYPAGQITISTNGGSCCAFYHDYEFAANADVCVCELKKEFSGRSFILFLCAAINAENWRYNYYRKFSISQIEKLSVKLPSKKIGQVDFKAIEKMMKDFLNSL